MKHFYENVPKLGNVAVSRHAQARMMTDGISQEAFDKALLSPAGPDIPDGMDVLWRQREGVRIVILTKPVPDVGAKLVKTVYRVLGSGQGSLRKRQTLGTLPARLIPRSCRGGAALVTPLGPGPG
jgi:hypothetical protein